MTVLMWLRPDLFQPIVNMVTRLRIHLQVVEWIDVSAGLIAWYLIQRKPFEFHFSALKTQDLHHRFPNRSDPCIGLVRVVVYPRWLDDCSPSTDDIEIMTIEQDAVVRIFELVDGAVGIVQGNAPHLPWTMYFG